VEGARSISVALEAGVPLEALYVAASGATHVDAEAVVEQAQSAGIGVYGLAQGVMERVADTVTPQPLMAVAPFVDVPLSTLRGAAPLVVCAGVRDPGNAGTVIRSAEAAGAAGVVMCRGSVDLYNPKTVRASAGALFLVPVVSGPEAVWVLEELAGWGVRRLAAVARGGSEYTATDLRGSVALVIGNEAQGLGPEVGARVDGQVSIPMAGRADSLNAGVAAALLCFEALRQRRALTVGV
jgi:TrmH family RNA methyltransferase